MDVKLAFIISLVIFNEITFIAMYLTSTRLEDERFKLIVSQNNESYISKRFIEIEDKLKKTKEELKKTNDSLNAALNRCYEAELKNQKVLEVFCDKEG